MNSRMKLRTKKSQGGFGLIELVIVLAIIAIAVVALYQKAGGARNDQGVAEEIGRIQIISDNIKSVYKAAPNFTGLTQTIARNAQVFPEGMDDGANVFNVWGGTVTVAPAADLAGNANRAFNITTTQIPQEACSKFAPGVSSAVQISIGATVVKTANNPINVGTLAARCAADAAASPTNTVTTTFYYLK